MNETRRQLRKAIAKMSRREATAWLASFEIREEEEQAILLCDIYGMSAVAAADKMHISPELVSRRRASGYDRIYRDLNGVIPS